MLEMPTEPVSPILVDGKLNGLPAGVAGPPGKLIGTSFWFEFGVCGDGDGEFSFRAWALPCTIPKRAKRLVGVDIGSVA